jgi:hypothetical protein
MAQNVINFEQARETLSWIREGMGVVDRQGRDLGTVKEVHFASFSSEMFSKSLEFFRLPFEDQANLIKFGYIQIARGVLEHDCFATPDQIATVNDRGVRLNVDVEKLTCS